MNASRTFSLVGLLLASAGTLGWSTDPVAAQNYAPPSGAILDLSGQTLPVNSPTSYDATFTAGGGDTTLAFLFRDDYWYIQFSDVALFDVTTNSFVANWVTGFSNATPISDDNPNNPNTPTGWNYFVDPSLVANGVFADGFLAAGTGPMGCVGGGNCWLDGTQGGYDELSQKVKLSSGDSYRISFDATVTAPLPESSTTWSSVITNDGGTGFNSNAADVLVYLGSVGQQTPVTLSPPPLGGDCPDCPEASTWAMMLLGFAGLAFVGHRRASALAA